jgi:hypothetical protein
VAFQKSGAAYAAPVGEGSMNAAPQRGLPFRVDPAALTERAMQSLVRASIAQSARIFERDAKGALPSAESILRKRGWADDHLASLITRASTGPAMTTQAGWAQELVQVAIAFLEILTPMSAGAQLLAAGLNLQFGGAGTILVPGIAPGQAKWIAEGAAIPAVQFLTTGPTLTPRKLASTCAVTEEMLRNLNAETIIRQALIDSTAPAIDAALFSNTAASASQPAGLLLGAVNVTPSASGDQFDAMGSDIGALVSAVGAYAGNGNVMLIANAAQAARYRMYSNEPFPMLMSATLTPGTVVCCALNAIASVIEPVAVDAAPATALYEDDANPSSTSPTKSMFQSACVALKVRLPASWCVRASGAISYLSGAKW